MAAHAWLILLLGFALLPLPLASAGSAEDPEVTDPQGDTRDPAGGLQVDIVAGWIENETAESFVTVLRLDRFDPRAAPGALLRFAMAYGDGHYFTDAFVNPDGSMFYGYGTLKDDRREPEVQSQEPTTGSIAPGSPGHVRVVFHKKVLPQPPTAGNASAPRLLESLEGITGDATAYAADIAGTQVPWIVDRAEGQRAYALNDSRPTSPPPAPASPSVVKGNATSPSRDEPPTAPTHDAPGATSSAPREVPFPGLLSLGLGIAAAATAGLGRARRA